MWVVVICFMWLQSIQHTILVRQQSVERTYQNYLKPKLDSRFNILTNLAGSHQDELINAQYDELLHLIKVEFEPNEMIRLNYDLTLFLDEHAHELLSGSSKQQLIHTLQTQIKEESLIYNAHAEAFNNLIRKWPFYWFASDYTQWVELSYYFGEGVVVER